ncbi:hypothetical protein BGX27_009191 [Mortierella sp. AM989]|nr:hypothetical protein BGX27_009191 [Mortierella sp. AM989]
MKRNSTQQSTSGTLSFAAAAAQRNTPKANPATPPPPSSQQPAAVSSLNQSAPASQTQSSTATTSSSGSQGAAVSSNNPSSQSKQQQSAPKPATPTTANGNYSSVVAKASHANANRRSQASTAAAAVKGSPAGKPTAAAVVAAPAGSASTASVPASGASSIRFGSINEPESGSSTASTGETAPAAQAAGTAMTFGSIPASMAPSKSEETTAAPTPASQEPVQPVSHAPEHVNPFKPIPQHVPQQHMSYGHHRRTDSSSSAHANDPSHYRSQGPPAVSQGPMIAPVGISQPGPSYANRAPVKTHGMAPMNTQPQIHAMPHQHPHQQTWQQPQHFYMPPEGYMYQQMYSQQQVYMPPQRMPTRAPSFTPSHAPYTPPAPTPSKKIIIKDPNSKAEVQFPTFNTSNDNRTQKAPATVELKKPEEEKLDYVKPSAAKSAIPIVRPEEKERELKEKEEKERLEREEKERIEKEAKEAEERRIREEQAEKERLEAEARAEQERKEREERELKEKEERERKEQEERELKEKEERERKEQEERERKEQAEKERLEEERAEVERKRKEEEERIAREKAEAEKVRLEKEKAEHEAKEKLEAERRIALEEEKHKQEEASKAEAEKKSETPAPAVESKPVGPDSAKSGLSVDLSRTASAPSSSHSARIENFNAVSYPSHIQSPGNADGQGKFRYDRDFLMQFMNVCTDKPDSLPSLDVLGGDGGDRGMQSPGGARGGGARGSMGGGRPKPAQPMGSFNLGGMKLNGGGMQMGMRNPSADTRLQHRTNSDSNFLPRNNLSRPPSQRGSRGGKRGGGGGGQGRGGDRGHQEPALTIPIADIVPLEKTDNAWTPNVNAASQPVAITADEPMPQDVVARKVKGLLNKLTLEKFDSISEKVIDIANLSSKESDGATLKHCIQIIFEKATDEPNFGSVYAMLCQRLWERISPDVKDASVEGSTGGKLFRKYLLHRCQEDFMMGWKDKATAGGASLNDKDGPDLMSDEYYVLMKAKRQGLGLIHFIGELFKLNMLTEKIMHECVKKLLANVKDPEEEETEGLCKLMTTVGLQLDRPEAKNHMDVYFVRMAELTKNNKLPSRIRFMVQDVIELRSNKWVNRRAASGPKTIAAIHEEAQRQQDEKEMMRRTASSGGGRGLPNRREQLSRVSSYRGSGDARHDMGGVAQVGADGWSTVPGAPVLPKKAGDLSSFGNTSRSKVNGLPSLGPSQSVFGSLNKGKRAGDKVATQAEPTRQLSSNAFAALEIDGGDPRGGVDAEKPMERKKLNLAPRTVPIAAADSTAESKTTVTDADTDAPKKTEDEAKRSIANTLKEYLSLKDMNEVVESIKELDACYRPLFVTEFVNQSMEMKQSEVDNIAEIFKKLNTEKILSTEDFEAGFTDPLEFLPDTAIDVPNAYKYATQLLEAAGMDPTRAAKP